MFSKDVEVAELTKEMDTLEALHAAGDTQDISSLRRLSRKRTKSVESDGLSDEDEMDPSSSFEDEIESQVASLAHSSLAHQRSGTFTIQEIKFIEKISMEFDAGTLGIERKTHKFIFLAQAVSRNRQFISDGSKRGVLQIKPSVFEGLVRDEGVTTRLTTAWQKVRQLGFPSISELFAWFTPG